jgi:SAM-dependent methyltransferase
VDADGTLMRDIVGWDVRTWSTAINYWERTLGDTDAPLTCLELGAGPGGPTLWLALRGHHVICSNWANTREQASPLHERYDVPGTIEYVDIDATSIPYENHFDLIVFKSVLGGVGSDGGLAQQKAMDQIVKALKPGGRLLFAENVRGTIIHRMIRAFANRARRAAWHYPSYTELRGLLSPFASRELRTTGVLAVFGVKESQRRALAGADQAVFNKITPARWRYMGYGTAVKAAQLR